MRLNASRRRSNVVSHRIQSSLMLVIGLLIFFAQPATYAARTPDPKPPRWELEFRVVHGLRLIEIQGSYYWFMTYLVTNRSGSDQTFVPNATLYTDAGDIITDGDVDFAVNDELLELLGNPLLESKTEIIGPLLQGKENAREGLLVWKAGDLDIDTVSIFVSGLSSETQIAVNSHSGEESIVRKTLALEYDVPGDPLGRIRKPVLPDGQRWIMR